MSKIVENYYTRSVEIEWSRMDRHPLEFEITKRHIEQFLQPNSNILDVGGGPGKYALHYTSKGHHVTLLDLSPANIAYAIQKAKELELHLEDAIVGNATAMTSIKDQAYDFVLCMGPLYHLVDPAARTKVLKECRRVLKDDGKVLFSYITHMAQTISVIKRNISAIDKWESSLEKGIETGINDTVFDTGFTEAFFIKPEAIRENVESAGYRVLKIAGAEGLACPSEEILKKLDKPALTRWIEYLFKYSEDVTTLGANQHVICVAEKEIL